MKTRKNVTVTMSEETARWARIEAARRDTSLSRYLGDLLDRERTSTEAYADARRRYMAKTPTPLGPTARSLPDREELHLRGGPTRPTSDPR